jgi:hypothetical protein
VAPAIFMFFSYVDNDTYSIGLGFNSHHSEIDVFSDTVGNWVVEGQMTEQVETPLPAALPLFATGLGGLGLLGWRRKRKAKAVA